MNPEVESPQGELNFDSLTVGELRDRYLAMVGVPARTDVRDNLEFLEQATASPEASKTERDRLREADAEADRDDRQWKR